MSELFLAGGIALAGMALIVPVFRQPCWRCGGTADRQTLLEKFFALCVGHRVICLTCWRKKGR